MREGAGEPRPDGAPRFRVARFGAAAAFSLTLAGSAVVLPVGCSPDSPASDPGGGATAPSAGETAAAVTESPAAGTEAPAAASDSTAAGTESPSAGSGASSLPRPELHPGMPGVLNEAEIEALRAARERALGEIADLPDFGFGEAADAERIAAWDIDIGPDGEGLPAGRGTVERGETLYRLQCVQCHGLRGEGADYEALAGRVPGDAFPFAEEWRFPITVGSYWPYATTLFDYIRRAMPQAAPGTLPPNDVYALTAYVLHLNDLLEPGDTLDAGSLPRVVMPARDRFVRDDRRGGPEVR